MKDTLKAGLTHTFSYVVPPARTVPFLYPESPLFRTMPEVFATGYLVGFLEWACMEALAPYLDAGECSLGTLVNITHEAATPPGMTVTATVTLLEVDGKRTRWEVTAKDEVDIIGRGTHERVTVQQEKFAAKTASKGK